MRSKATMALACTLLLAAGTLPAQAQTDHDFETATVAEGIYAFIAKESRSGVVQGNVVLIAGDDGAILVDSGQFPPLARKMVAEIRKLTSQPVRALVISHWHGDHLLAVDTFQQSFPGLRVVAHAETRRLGAKNYADWPERVRSFPKLIATLRERVAAGKRKDGTPLTEDEKVSYQTDADALEAVLPDVSESKCVPPDTTFLQEITFYLGKREVRVSNLGLGNTMGDAVTYVPDARVLITGDTVVYPTPYSFGSFHSEWIEVLKKMIALDALLIVPGHGPVMNDASYLKTLIALLEETREQVRAAVKQGLTLEQTRKQMNLEKFRNQLAGNHPDRQRAFRDFFEQPGIERAYKEAKGEPRTE